MGRTLSITDANTGIGFEVARVRAEKDAPVFLGMVLLVVVGWVLPAAAQNLPEVSLHFSNGLIIDESDGANTITATLDQAAQDTVTVTVAAAPANYDPENFAELGDFELSANRVLTFAANSTTSTGTVTFTPVDNTTDDLSKRVRVTGEVSGNATTPRPAEILIEDDDPQPTKTAELTSTAISEKGGVSTVRATLSNGSTRGPVELEMEIHLPVADGAQPEDFTIQAQGASVQVFSVGPDSTLAATIDLEDIPVRETQSPTAVTITAVDNNVDGPPRKRLQVRVKNLNRLGVPTEPGFYSPMATLYIDDDDDDDASPGQPANRPPTVSASCDPCSVYRGGEVHLTATASDQDDDPLSYSWRAKWGRRSR